MNEVNEASPAGETGDLERLVSRQAVIGDKIRTTYPFLNGKKVTMTLDTQDMVDDVNAILPHKPCAWELL